MANKVILLKDKTDNQLLPITRSQAIQIVNDSTAKPFGDSKSVQQALSYLKGLSWVGVDQAQADGKIVVAVDQTNGVVFGDQQYLTGIKLTDLGTDTSAKGAISADKTLGYTMHQFDNRIKTIEDLVSADADPNLVDNLSDIIDWFQGVSEKQGDGAAYLTQITANKDAIDAMDLTKQTLDENSYISSIEQVNGKVTITTASKSAAGEVSYTAGTGFSAKTAGYVTASNMATELQAAFDAAASAADTKDAALKASLDGSAAVDGTAATAASGRTSYAKALTSVTETDGIISKTATNGDASFDVAGAANYAYWDAAAYTGQAINALYVSETNASTGYVAVKYSESAGIVSVSASYTDATVTYNTADGSISSDSGLLTDQAIGEIQKYVDAKTSSTGVQSITTTNNAYTYVGFSTVVTSATGDVTLTIDDTKLGNVAKLMYQETSISVDDVTSYFYGSLTDPTD